MASGSGVGHWAGYEDIFADPEVLNLEYLSLTAWTFREKIAEIDKNESTKPEKYHTLWASNNQLYDLPRNLSQFVNLRHLILNNNRLRSLPDCITTFPLVFLSAKNNLIEAEGLPKSFAAWASTIGGIDLGGNNLGCFPDQILQLTNLKHLYLGSNHIETLPRNINILSKLSTLCLGGNLISDLPETVGLLEDLEVLVVCDNDLESLPSSIANLKNLKTLQLHKNRLRTLPTEIIELKCLSELSLRDNPLVVRFVNDMTHNPATLLELAGRSIINNDVPYSKRVLPGALLYYLHSAHRCVNPKCNGVFFDSRVGHVKFVDFCGKYRIPLLQYLCSSKCVVDNDNLKTDDCMMRRVLLG